MTLNLAQARADYDDVQMNDCKIVWFSNYASDLLTALEARSGDMELAARLADLIDAHHDASIDVDKAGAEADVFSFVNANLPTILKALKGGA